MRHILQYIIGKFTELVEQPLFNFISISVTLSSIAALFIHALAGISLETEQLATQANKIFLTTIAIETFIKIMASKSSRYIQSPAFGIDIITLIPLALDLVTLTDKPIGIDQPGFLLFQGMRSLRLLPATIYFYKQRNLITLMPNTFSPIKSILLSRTAIFTAFMILTFGFGIAFAYGNALKTQRLHRTHQILIQARSHGVLQARLVFENLVLGAYITQGGQKTYIPGTSNNPINITKNYKYERDYKQLDEPQPGQSILISFKDIALNQKRVELLILLLGMLLIASLLYMLNYYINKLIVTPLEVSQRTLQLRLSGEEIHSTQIQRKPYTEIIRSINDADRLYQKMRAPARKLLEDKTPL